MTLSIIIPTKNSAIHLEPLLRSLIPQISKNDEIIVVDNFSNDETKKLIGGYKAVKFYEKGPERNTQRIFGAEKARGSFLCFLDSDMEAEMGFIQEIKKKLKAYDALIIPEKPWGAGNFWTKAKIEERAYQQSEKSAHAARAMTRKMYEKTGGWDAKMVSAEDWDLTQKIRKVGGKIGYTERKIKHNESEVRLKKIWQKKFYYGKKSKSFTQKNGKANLISHVFFLKKSFYKALPKLMKNSEGAGAIFLLFWGLVAGGFGAMANTFKPKK